MFFLHIFFNFGPIASIFISKYSLRFHIMNRANLNPWLPFVLVWVLIGLFDFVYVLFFCLLSIEKQNN